MSSSSCSRTKLRPCAHEFITTFEAMREDIFLEMAHFEEVEGELPNQLLNYF